MVLQHAAATRFINYIYIYLYIYIYIYIYTLNITQKFRRLCIPLVSCRIRPVYQPAITGVAVCKEKVGRQWAKSLGTFQLRVVVNHGTPWREDQKIFARKQRTAQPAA